MAKGKVKGKDARRSRSRNTTPISSTPSQQPAASRPIASQTAFLDLNIASLQVPTNLTYSSIIDRLAGGSSVPDTSHLETLAADLHLLLQIAKSRYNENRLAMNRLKEKRLQLREEEEERVRIQPISQLDEDQKSSVLELDLDEKKPDKAKRRKERSATVSERPLNHGAHAPARQDGLDIPIDAPIEEAANTEAPSVMKREASRTSSSPLSETSLPQFPPIPSTEGAIAKVSSDNADSPDSDDSQEERQPAPAMAQPQYQTFGENPLLFDDPTVYEVREVTEDMDDEERKEIYNVASFPHSDLRDLIAGSPPDGDFSNAVKPNNQVQPHTFATYLDGYLRPLREEDIGFLNERGDRVTPLMIPARSKRHYTEIWAEEDGTAASKSHSPLNQGRGSLDDMDDEVAQTNQVSIGPMATRLLSAMRFEHRAPVGDDKTQNTDIALATDVDSFMSTHDSREASKPQAPATLLPDGARSNEKLANLSHAQIDERIKAELRHIGFLSAEDEPDYESHLDDEVAERLRWLQERLKRVSITNGARKRRILELAEEQLAYQEYSTILEDLDGQVQQAYLKRARTTGKSKKGTKRPGGSGLNTAVVSKPGIGDVARQLMDRRARWEEKIGPVFRDDIRRVRGKNESIFEDADLEPYLRLETAMFNEEAE